MSSATSSPSSGTEHRAPQSAPSGVVVSHALGVSSDSSSLRWGLLTRYQGTGLAAVVPRWSPPRDASTKQLIVGHSTSAGQRNATGGSMSNISSITRDFPPLTGIHMHT